MNNRTSGDHDFADRTSDGEDFADYTDDHQQKAPPEAVAVERGHSAAGLLSETVVLLVVQSEFADPDRSLRMLRRTGIDATIVAEQHIPFGPVPSARAAWMQRAGLVESGRRQEKLVVIRGEKR